MSNNGNVKNKAFVVIPTYNERENIQALLSGLNEHYLALSELIELNVIFIDDNSPDKTAALIEETKSLYQFKIDVVKRLTKGGLGGAYIHGFGVAIERGADYVVQMDADLSHQPRFLIHFFDALRKYDFVIGSRYMQGGKIPNWGILRRAVSKFGNYYAQFILGSRISDLTGGFNAYRTSALQSINLPTIKSTGYAFQIELKYLLSRENLQYTEIPIEFVDREVGKSKMSLSIVFEAIWRPIKLRFQKR